MKLKFYTELEITRELSEQINALLQASFSEVDYEGRDYFKQLPHYRIVAFDQKKVIGHLSLDLRVMNLNQETVHVLGVVDLCVDPNFKGQGIGQALLDYAENIAQKSPNKVDFLLLVADDDRLYQKVGFQRISIETQWLKLHQHQNYGVGKEKIEDAFFLIKSVHGRTWENGSLDYLGYMY
ncbi:MAG: GNAT family N-acetyltransferase [Saprospiraceae bacterium]|nr:GNAT family N-acetyltransferase [Saprospiraceae bacterium]